MDILTRTAERLFMPLCLGCGLGPGREGSGRALEPGGSSRGAKSLRPDLRTANSEDGRTSYWQGLEQTRQKTARTVFQALRGSPCICVTCSKVRSQAIRPHGIGRPAPHGRVPSLSSLFYSWPGSMFLYAGALNEGAGGVRCGIGYIFRQVLFNCPMIFCQGSF